MAFSGLASGSRWAADEDEAASKFLETKLGAYSSEILDNWSEMWKRS